MLTRKEQLEFCKFCLNRKFSPQDGIICKLTGEKANFIDNCKDYTQDDIAIHREKIFQEENHLRQYPKDFTFGLDKVGIKNGIVAGTILITLGLVWLIVGWQVGFIFWYPFIMILMGVISLINGIVNSVIRKKLDNDIKKASSSDDVLDD